MRAAPFKYVSVATGAEATATLTEYGDDARVLAGGQSLLPLIALRLAVPSVLVDVSSSNMAGVTVNDFVRVGATTTQSAAMQSSDIKQHAPLVVDALGHVAHHAIRNRGTVGGAIAHADPAAELPAVLIANGGEVDVAAGDGSSRTINADDLFEGVFSTSLSEAEVITEVRFRKDRDGWAFHEIARRKGDYAMAGMATTWQTVDNVLSDVRLSLFSAGPHPERIPEAEAALNGQELTPETIEAAANAAAEAVDAVADIHCSAPYRRRLTRVAVSRGLIRAANGGHRT